MVYADLGLNFRPIRGILPLKVDLSEGSGGHYLDITTVLVDGSRIRGRNGRQFMDPTKDNEGTREELGDVSLHVTTVEETTRTDTGSGTDDIRGTKSTGTRNRGNKHCAGRSEEYAGRR